MGSMVAFAFEERLVRAVDRDGDPWFVGKDVCSCLDLRNHNDALAGLDDDEKGVVTADTLGGQQTLSVISEPGVYRLVFRSRKPEAERFKRWLAHDVLPRLRRAGKFEMDETSAGPSGVLASARDMANAPLLHRLYLLDRVARLYGRATARVMYGQLGLPPVPPPPMTDQDEARLCLRTLLDAPVFGGGMLLRQAIERALDDDEEARAVALSSGVRVFPDRETFVIANRSKHVADTWAGDDWSVAPQRLLRRLPGVGVSAAVRMGTLVSRGIEVPASYLE